MKIYCPKIYGKKQYDLASQSRAEVISNIKKYYHLTRRQFFALGGSISHVVNEKKISEFLIGRAK